MSTSNWITVGSISAGLFTTMIGSVWVVSFQIGSLREKASSIERTVGKLGDRMVQTQLEIGEIKDRLGKIEVKLNILWRGRMTSDSSIALTRTGVAILTKSAMGVSAREHYNEILWKVASFQPANAQQAEEILISIMSQWKDDRGYKAVLQRAAISAGYDVDSLLFVAALSIRDRIISDLHFV
jgi:hypothetical protein